MILNGPFPYRAHWQVALASVFYFTGIVTYLVFAALLIARWVMYPHVALRRAMSDPDELGAYAIPPIALMTIAALTASQVSTGPWGGHGWTIVTYVLWWIGVSWIFATAIVVLMVLVYTGNQADRVMTPVLFMAPVGLATAGTEAGFITVYSNSMSARMAVPQIIVGYFATGVALFMAIILYTIFFHRLLVAGFIAPAKRPASFILVRPCGQLGTAFQILGTSVNQYMRFARYKPAAVHPPDLGTFWTPETGQGVDGAGIFLSLLLLGFDYLCLAIAIIAVLDVFVKRQATYTLSWWAIVFPTVTLTSAWLQLSFAMDSPTFRGLTTSMLLLLSVVYVINLGFTLRGIVIGSLVFAKTQMQIEDDMMAQAKREGDGSDKEV